MPLEVFMRRALCVAYFYQCLSNDSKCQSACQCRSERVVTPLDLGLQPVLADGERCNTRSQAVLEITRDHGLDRERLGDTGWSLALVTSRWMLRTRSA